MSTYILQKDWICPTLTHSMVLKKGEEFVPKKLSCGGIYQHKSGWSFPIELVENNPEWFRPYTPFDNLIEFTNTLSPHQKVLFEKVLKDDTRVFTEEDMRKCFEASRDFTYKSEPFNQPVLISAAYNKFEDYIKTVK